MPAGEHTSCLLGPCRSSSSSSVDPGGWTAELRIPFSQLHSAGPPNSVGSRGVNFRRDLARSGELSSWAPYPRNPRRVAASLGEMTGLEGVRSSLRLAVTPYSMRRAATPSGATRPGGFRKPPPTGGLHRPDGVRTTPPVTGHEPSAREDHPPVHPLSGSQTGLPGRSGKVRQEGRKRLPVSGVRHPDPKPARPRCSATCGGCNAFCTGKRTVRDTPGCPWPIAGGQT